MRNSGGIPRGLEGLAGPPPAGVADAASIDGYQLPFPRPGIRSRAVNFFGLRLVMVECAFGYLPEMMWRMDTF
jgi:hypothetical protein